MSPFGRLPTLVASAVGQLPTQSTSAKIKQSGRFAEIMSVRWTHFTLPVSDLDGSIRFFTEVCGLAVVRDRRQEGGTTVWLGPAPAPSEEPEFVVVVSGVKSGNRSITLAFNASGAKR